MVVCFLPNGEKALSMSCGTYRCPSLSDPPYLTQSINVGSLRSVPVVIVQYNTTTQQPQPLATSGIVEFGEMTGERAEHELEDTAQYMSRLRDHGTTGE